MATIFSLLILLFSVIIHEVAHGSVANYLGDPTAKYHGRLTLNPIKHLDLLGSVILPLTLALAKLPVIGWAKPVPVNPYNFRDQKWGDLKVSLAGPASNLLVGIIFSLILRFVPLPGSLLIPFGMIAIYNFLLAIFNLIPIPPLDGSWILFSFFPRSLAKTKIFLQQYGMLLLIFIIFLFDSSLNWIYSWAYSLFHLIAG
jgi:Zn-dependent protease